MSLHIAYFFAAQRFLRVKLPENTLFEAVFHFFSSRLVLLVLLLALLPLSATAATKDSPTAAWRMAYVEGGPHPAFSHTLSALVLALKGHGLIERADIPPELSHDSAAQWRWLGTHAGGVVKFLPDGYYSAGWDSQSRTATKEKLLRRIQQDGDVDCILALGTSAGKDMASAEHSVPTFILAVTDPVSAGISRTATDSGFDHVYMQVLPYREQRQLALFHSMFRFSRLGIMYEDTPEGRAFCGLPRIEAAAVDLGFELVRCALNPAAPNKAEQMRQCLRMLTQQAEAVYLTYAAAGQDLPLGEVLAPLIRAELPTFSQTGLEETRLGALMSLSQQSYMETASLMVRDMISVMGGATPRGLTRVLSPRLGLAINLRTAMLIDWDLPQAALVAVDELCDQVSAHDTLSPPRAH